MANYYSLGQKQHIDAEILKIGHRLDIAVCEQSFSIQRSYVKRKYFSNEKMEKS